ncbi:hypothetical protein SNEBB_003238 [Seison nebaliae]|nr:hypothetical protein SNEBB_003238 [Seison nebaliae]
MINSFDPSIATRPKTELIKALKNSETGLAAEEEKLKNSIITSAMGQTNLDKFADRYRKKSLDRLVESQTEAREDFDALHKKNDGKSTAKQAIEGSEQWKTGDNLRTLQMTNEVLKTPDKDRIELVKKQVAALRGTLELIRRQNLDYYYYHNSSNRQTIGFVNFFSFLFLLFFLIL